MYSARRRHGFSTAPHRTAARRGAATAVAALLYNENSPPLRWRCAHHVETVAHSALRPQLLRNDSTAQLHCKA